MNLFLHRAIPHFTSGLPSRFATLNGYRSTSVLCILATPLRSTRTFVSLSRLRPVPSKCSTLYPLQHFTRLFSCHLLPRSTLKLLVCRDGTKRMAVMWMSSGIPRGNRLQHDKNKNTMMLITAVVVMVLGLSYAAVPLYRIYCQKTGKGGQAVLEDDINEKVAALEKVADHKLTIRFEAEKSARLAWDFKPSQQEITCSPGETVLAFYTARNHLDRPVNGIATYTILPFEAGKYFNKIQCFCFEEQQLNAEEEVDLPVFFYIDPEYSKDPYLFENDNIVLSYNFFETKDGYKLPQPPSYRGHRSMQIPSQKEIAVA